MQKKVLNDDTYIQQAQSRLLKLYRTSGFLPQVHVRGFKKIEEKPVNKKDICKETNQSYYMSLYLGSQIMGQLGNLIMTYIFDDKGIIIKKIVSCDNALQLSEKNPFGVTHLQMKYLEFI